MAFHGAGKKALQHLELAERFSSEGKELVGRDLVQAGEKLYEAAEEAVKAIATALKLPPRRLPRGVGGQQVFLRVPW
jgi:hypothetical protein